MYRQSTLRNLRSLELELSVNEKRSARLLNWVGAWEFLSLKQSMTTGLFGGHAFCLPIKLLTSLADGEVSSPPLPPSPVFAKVFQIFGRKSCKETFFALQNGIFHRKERSAPTVHAAGHDWKFERSDILSSSPVFLTDCAAAAAVFVLPKNILCACVKRAMVRTKESLDSHRIAGVQFKHH